MPTQNRAAEEPGFMVKKSPQMTKVFGPEAFEMSSVTSLNIPAAVSLALS